MGTTITGVIKPIFRGESRDIMFLLKLNGSAQDITGDTVKLVMKTDKSLTDANASLVTNADVSTYGSAGYALFELSTSNTDLDPDDYFTDVTWTRSGKEYIVYDNTVTIKERVSDT